MTHCVVFKVLDECGKSFRTLTDNDYTLASTAVSTYIVHAHVHVPCRSLVMYNIMDCFSLRIRQKVSDEMLLDKNVFLRGMQSSMLQQKSGCLQSESAVEPELE